MNLYLLDRHWQQVSKMMITRIVSMNFLFRHNAHEWIQTMCQTSWLVLSQTVIKRIERECRNRFIRVEWNGTITVSHVSHSNKTSDRNDEKMYSVTNKRYFRRHGCPCEDLWRWPQCHVFFDCHVVGSRAWSELSKSADCQSERSRVWSELFQSAGDCQSEYSRVWSELHSRHAEDEDEDAVVHVQVCSTWLNSNLRYFFKVFCFLTFSISSSLAFNFSDDLPR